jgi:transcriptional regulator with XRE-family HTH domain
MPIAKINKVKSPALTVFGEAIRQRRKALGYSQEAFGDACGIDRSYMGGIERGEHNLALINILKIIDALGVLPSEFFKDLDKPTKALRKTKI